MISHSIPSSPTLEQAVRDFNAAFDFDLRLPLYARDLESAAIIAELRGRQDIAIRLREVLS